MWLKVDPRFNTPIYQQIVEGVKAQVARGILRPGERLPTVRELAADISVNYNTVAKAYQELERERVIELVQGRGTFVAEALDVPDIHGRKRDLRDAMKKWFVDAHYAHMTEADVATMFQEVLAEWRQTKGGIHS